MPINVGYEPVAAIGPAALAAGQGQYRKFLEEYQQRERMQAAQIAAQQQMQYASIQAQKDAQRENARIQAERAAADDEYRWAGLQRLIDNDKFQQGSYSDKMAEEAENKRARDAALIKLGFDPSLPQGMIGSAYDNKLQNDRRSQQAADQVSGMGVGFQGMVPEDAAPDFMGPETPDTARWMQQYSPQQQAELLKIQNSAQKVMSSQDLTNEAKLTALQQLQKQRENIIPIQQPRVTTLPDGTDIIDVGGGKMHVQPPPRPERQQTPKEYLDMLQKAKSVLRKTTQNEFGKTITIEPTREEVEAFVQGLRSKPEVGQQLTPPGSRPIDSLPPQETPGLSGQVNMADKENELIRRAQARGLSMQQIAQAVQLLRSQGR